MASNLKDKGYPSAKEYRPNRSDKRYAVMTGNVDSFPYRGAQQMTTGFEPVERTDNLDRLITAYNNKAFGSPNAPMLTRGSYDYIDDNTDSRAYDSNIGLWAHNGNRLGVLGKNVIDGVRTMYSAGIDNLTPILGEGNFNKEVATPFGALGVEYDGDTLAGSLDVPSKDYYLVALKTLLDRGQL